MYKKFEALDDEKKQRIINAAIGEFHDKGYENASTNTITRNAGISKGLLFHYFKNKKNLFFYIVNYVINTIMDDVEDAGINKAPDIFDRIIDRSLVKLELAKKYSRFYKIIIDAYRSNCEEIKKEFNEIYAKIYKHHLANFLDGLDTTKFRKGISAGKAIEIILMCIEGLGEKYIKLYDSRDSEELIKDMAAIRQEYMEYLEILKYGVYPENTK